MHTYKSLYECGSSGHMPFSGNVCRPQEIDEAARRRFVKRLYVPLPGGEARKQIVQLLMSRQANSLTDDQFTAICDQTEGAMVSVLLKSTVNRETVYKSMKC